MSLTFGFYNSINGDRVYDAIQMGQIFDGIITDGIYATYLKAMVVKASDNASEVIVQPGRAWFNHTWTYIDADYPVEAPAPEVILDRVDTLVLDINAEYSDRENKILWVTGTPASVNPEVPALINTTTHHQYPLCNVYRKAGTTMIYAADITNRVGTSATPFVTGVLTGINIDDLLSQWDDEFHTWENNTKTSFEAWMLNQQSVYTTWFNSIRTQMNDDLTEFEAWFETIRGIIDEEAATHLQAEIDELKDMLPAGSHIDISTNESTLFNRNVTVSDGVHSKTVQFNASGAATVESFPYIGAISVTSTDGERTAQETINIPYFGRYSVVLAFWSATVNLVGDSAVGGVPVTVKDSDDLTITTIVLDASGRGTFTATKPDTYKFTYTYGGQTMETTLQVTQETTYEVEIHGGFNYQAWLTAGRVSKTFTSLDDILTDEKTLRQLFLVHDAVDYLASQTVNPDVEKIFNTDLAAKWINNSDYALDTFYAVADIKALMDTADKYGYGEWVIIDDTTTPPTWGAKGNVPVMTNLTAPYGASSMSGTAVSGSESYHIFDRNAQTSAQVSTGITSGRIYYKFTNPTNVRRVYFAIQTNGGITRNVKWQYSDDGTTWTDAKSESIVQTAGYFKHYTDIPDCGYHLYWACYTVSITGSSTTAFERYGNELQFYGRELKVSVPVMTSDTAPYGEASAQSNWSSSYAAYMAFRNNTERGWTPASFGHHVLYNFKKSVVLKTFALYRVVSYDDLNATYKLKGSNDGTNWTYIDDPITTIIARKWLYYSVNNNTPYKQYAVEYVSNNADINAGYGMLLQFYGLDYSEKEFEFGTTKKWLYDHGVELETLTATKDTNCIADKEDDHLYLECPQAQNVASAFMANIDLTNYLLVRAIVGKQAYMNQSPAQGATGLISVWSQTPNGSSTGRVAYHSVYIGTDPYTHSLDVSSLNQAYQIGVHAANGSGSGVYFIRKCEFTELWLE